MFAGNNTNRNSEKRTTLLINNYASDNNSINNSSRNEPIAGPSTRIDGLELQSISHNNENELGQTELHIAVLRNQPEIVRRLLQHSDIKTEVHDKNNKYPYEYAIDGKNNEILTEFSNFYKKCKTDIEQTQRALAKKSSDYDYRHEIINSFATFLGTACALYGVIALFTSESEVGVLKEFVLEEVKADIAWGYNLGVENTHFALKRLVEVTNETNTECIKNTEAPDISLNKTNEKISYLERRMARFKSTKEANITFEDYDTSEKSLKSFVDIHSMILAGTSLLVGGLLMLGLVTYAFSTRYLGQSRAQSDSLKKVNERLNQIEFAISDLSITQKINQHMDGLSLKKVNERLNKIESAISNLDTTQEINQNIRELSLNIREALLNTQANRARIARLESKLRKNAPNQTSSEDDESTSGHQSKHNYKISRSLTNVRITKETSRFLS